jgi:flagellar biosynthesis protein FlhG
MMTPTGRREMTRTRALAVTSGKGGVGKSTVAVNLAAALVARGERVVLLDADFSLANLDVLLQLTPGMNLADVLEGRCGLTEAVRHGPAGLRVVPATQGNPRMSSLSDLERAGLIQAFSDLSPEIDWLVIDTGAGMTPATLQFCLAAQDVLIVICDEPASLADASAMVRALKETGRRSRFRILVNMVAAGEDPRATFLRLVELTDSMSEVSLEYAGSVPYDRTVATAAREGQPVVTAHPDAPVTSAFTRLARDTGRWPLPSTASGQSEFFLENKIHNEVMERRVRI